MTNPIIALFPFLPPTVGIILITALFALILAFALGLALGFFRRFFAVPEDPLKGQIRAVLPGANCGACGFPGCDGYAGAAASGEAGSNRCPVGGTEVAAKIAALTGGNASVVSVVSILACRGSRAVAPLKGLYTGLKTCRGAKISTGGTKFCAWGCVGFGDCVKVCGFGALRMGDQGLPEIDYAKCTGCRLCAAECPQGLIRNVPRDRRGALALCSNHSSLRAQVIRNCKAGCIKCEACVRSCPEQCITMDHFLPVVDYDKCTSCGTCVSKCPTKVFHLIVENNVVQ